MHLQYLNIIVFLHFSVNLRMTFFIYKSAFFGIICSLTYLTKKTMILRPFLFAITFSLILLVPQAFAINDVPQSDPQFSAIQAVISTGAMSTDNQDNFRPNELINKAAFLKATFTHIGFEPENRLNTFTGFADVPEDSWFAPYVKRAQEARIITNKLNSSFYPNDPLTRQDALLMLMPLYGVPTPFSQPAQEELFNDIRPTRLFSYIFKVAKNSGIYFIGEPDYFRPTRQLTRADAAELIHRTANANPEGGAIVRVESVPLTIQPKNTDDLTGHQTFTIFADVWNRINDDFIYQERVDQQKLLHGAISGMVNTLEDPYSNFKTPLNGQDSFIYVPISYEGIGAVIERIDEKYVIQTTLNNSPAAKSGLRSNDIILEIDGTDTSDLEPDEVTTLLKGKAGTKVSIKIKRGASTLNFSITRAKISLDSVHAEILRDDIFYLRIDQFTQESYNEYKDIAEELNIDNYSKFIIDVRNNPGGYLFTTQQIMNHFLTSGKTTFFTTNNTNQYFEYVSEGPGEFEDSEIVVLINEGTASAAEILAGAFQDYDIATIIGEESFGKGTVQEIHEYEDGSSVKLTIAKWLTPDQNEYIEEGIQPDIEVELSSEDQRNERDPQLNRAIQVLQ